MESLPANEQAFDQRHAAEDVARLVRFLGRMDGEDFRLAVVEERDEWGFRTALSWLDQQASGNGLRSVAADLREYPGLSVLDALGRAVPDRPTGLLAIRGLRLAIAVEEDVPVVRQLNVQRDLLAQRFPCIWVLLVSPYVAHRLREDAPDFSDFASLWVESLPQPPSLEFGSVSLSEYGFRSGEPLVPFSHPDLAEAYALVSAWELDMARDRLAQFRLQHPDLVREHPAQVLFVEALILQREGNPAEACQLLLSAGCDHLAQNGGAYAVLAAILLAELLAGLGGIEKALAVLAACEPAAAVIPTEGWESAMAALRQRIEG